MVFDEKDTDAVQAAGGRVRWHTSWLRTGHDEGATDSITSVGTDRSVRVSEAGEDVRQPAEVIEQAAGLRDGADHDAIAGAGRPGLSVLKNDTRLRMKFNGPSPPLSQRGRDGFIREADTDVRARHGQARGAAARVAETSDIGIST